uniref:Uncharacterized protein n=1 Tax=Sus scrofa TaxID=9823 RepID=A0A8D0SE49_PIG
IHNLSHYQHHPQSGTFVTIDEPLQTHPNYPRSAVYIGVHSCSCCCTFYAFGQMYDDMYLHNKKNTCHLFSRYLIQK